MRPLENTRRVAIIGYNRIPFARSNTAYVHASNQDMLVANLNGLISKYHLEGKLLGEVAGGAVIKSNTEGNLVRESVMETKLDPGTPGVDLQQACITGIEAAVYIANKIALGQMDAGIACGVDSTSVVPIEAGKNFNSILLDARRAKDGWTKAKIFFKLRPKDFTPGVPKITEPKTGLTMGGHTELTAQYYGISREEQDLFALKSHHNLAAAYERGFFDDMVSPFLDLKMDNNLRADTSLEKLAKLKPAFAKENGLLNGTLTAGNSSPLTDGASSILLASEEWAKAQNLPVLAYISYMETAAIEYIENKQNLLLAPVFAANRMLKKANLTLQDFDYYELHEAFAAQVLTTLKIWESAEWSKSFGLEALGAINPDKINVNGSSLATGHPFAATGGRIIATLSKLLHEKEGPAKGFISICAARGQGMTMILEK